MTLKRGHPVKAILTCDERKRLVAFFSLLIIIDKRVNGSKRERKPRKTGDGLANIAGLVFIDNFFIFRYSNIALTNNLSSSYG